jgi:hypothetical protein
MNKEYWIVKKSTKYQTQDKGTRQVKATRIKIRYKTRYKTRLKSGKQKREKASKASRWETPSISKKFRYPTKC